MSWPEAAQSNLKGQNFHGRTARSGSYRYKSRRKRILGNLNESQLQQARDYLEQLKSRGDWAESRTVQEFLASIEPEAIRSVPEHICQRYKVLGLALHNGDGQAAEDEGLWNLAKDAQIKASQGDLGCSLAATGPPSGGPGPRFAGRLAC
ncbi:hypothetical protein JST97_21055 [bacterium]|nr:hypothetical protein [bacterium]